MGGLIKSILAQIQSWFGFYNVRYYGADPTGTNDSATAFQNAINAASGKGGKVVIPPGTFVIKTALKMTDLPNGGIIVEGSGMSNNQATVIRAETGGILFDTTGSQFLTFRDFTVIAGATTPSTLAFLFARSTTNQYAQFHNLENIKIDLSSNTNANGGWGTIGIYNYAAELWRARNVYILADRTVCFVSDNQFGLTSPYATIESGTFSMSECTIDGASTLTGYANPIRIANAYNITFDNTYFLLGQPVGSNNIYALEVLNDVHNLRITGHVESYNRLLYAAGCSLYNPVIDVTKQIMNTDDQVVLDGTYSATAIYGGYINVYPTLNTYAHNVISQLGANHNGVMGLRIVLNANQKNNTPTGYTSALSVLARDANPGMTLASVGYRAGTLVQHQQGTDVYGLLTFKDNYNFGTNTYGYGQAAPTTGTWSVGDTILNTAPSVQGTTGSQYTVLGWRCTTAGTPGTWSPMHAPTGT